MRYRVRIVPAASLIVAFVLSLILIAPSASACSLAQMPDWLSFVLNHGLANLNPDCTLTWKTGEVTDLNGNIVTQSPYALLQQYGIVFFFVGLVLAVVGIYLTVRSRHPNVK